MLNVPAPWKVTPRLPETDEEKASVPLGLLMTSVPLSTIEKADAVSKLKYGPAKAAVSPGMYANRVADTVWSKAVRSSNMNQVDPSRLPSTFQRCGSRFSTSLAVAQRYWVICCGLPKSM